MDKLTIEDVMQLVNYGTALYSLENKLASQLLDTMRENDRLREALEIIADWKVLDIAHAVVIANKAIHSSKTSKTK